MRAILNLGFRPFYSLAGLFAVIAVAMWLVSFTGMAQFGGQLQGVLWHSHEMVFGFIRRHCGLPVYGGS